MSQKSLFPSPRFKAPKIIRRLRHTSTLPGAVHLFDIYSLTCAGTQVQHHLEADLQTGLLRCSCGDFRFRHVWHEPTIADPTHICKHLHRVLDWLLRHKYLHGREVAVAALLRDLRPCCECGVEGAEYGLCDERGFPPDGFICSACCNLKREVSECDHNDDFDAARLADIEERLGQLHGSIRRLDLEWEAACVPNHFGWNFEQDEELESCREEIAALELEREALEQVEVAR